MATTREGVDQVLLALERILRDHPSLIAPRATPRYRAEYHPHGHDEN